MSTQFVQLTNVKQIARGDQAKYMRYLKQFEELVVQRVADLKEAMAEKNRERVIKVVHEMKPQVLFFEVSEAAQPMHAIEMQGVEMLWTEMEERCTFLVGQLEHAVVEVKSVISQQS